MTEEKNLTTYYDSRNSFYGKAVLIFLEEKSIVKLRSYETVVAEYNKKTNKMKVFGWYSMTTARHINEFLQLYGFDKATKKQMENWEE